MRATPQPQTAEPRPTPQRRKHRLSHQTDAKGRAGHPLEPPRLPPAARFGDRPPRGIARRGVAIPLLDQPARRQVQAGDAARLRHPASVDPAIGLDREAHRHDTPQPRPPRIARIVAIDDSPADQRRAAAAAAGARSRRAATQSRADAARARAGPGVGAAPAVIAAPTDVIGGAGSAGGGGTIGVGAATGDGVARNADGAALPCSARASAGAGSGTTGGGGAGGSTANVVSTRSRTVVNRGASPQSNTAASTACTSTTAAIDAQRSRADA